MQIATGEVVTLLVELIRNHCVNDGTPDSGEEHRSVATLADYFGRSGTIVEPHPGRQSVVYRVPGTDPEAPTLTLLPHLDVVPANPAGWQRDPFGGELVDGVVWGRGAVDMLNLTAAMAAVFKRYLQGEAPPLPGDLIFAAVADEEAGGGLGAAFLTDDRWDLVGCDYLLTEVASPTFGTSHGLALPVTVAEKGPAWRSIRLTGTPGHGSQPYATDNALVGLAEAVTRIEATPTPIEVCDNWARFVGSIGLADGLVERLSDPDRIDGAITEIADPRFARWVHACTHLTVAPTTFHSGEKQNTIPDDGSAGFDVRLVPGQDEAAAADHFRKALGPALAERVDIAPGITFAPTESPAAGPLWGAIEDAANAISGPTRLVPMLTPVVTDARFFRQRGAVAYGVGMFAEGTDFGEMLAMFHGNDERVAVASLALTTDLIGRTLAAFGARVASAS